MVRLFLRWFGTMPKKTMKLNKIESPHGAMRLSCVAYRLESLNHAWLPSFDSSDINFARTNRGGNVFGTDWLVALWWDSH